MTTPSASGVPSGPAIDFASRDAVSFRDSMIRRATTLLPDWVPGDENDFAQVFIELMAYLGDIESYYIDRAASETFLPTARLRSNVVNLASLLGYRPSGATAASVTLLFTGTDVTHVTIPQRTQVSTVPATDTPPVVFETDTAVSFSGGVVGVNQTISVTATQGVTVVAEALAFSTGGAAQFYTLVRSPVIQSSVQVSVQDDPNQTARAWGYVDHLIESGPYDEVFSTDTSDAGITMVVFGNNVTGKEPPRGAAITATYRVGGGVTGNVTIGSLVAQLSPITGVLAVTNQVVATGGQDIEDIESIRVNAPFAYAAQNRAINDADFAGLALRVAGVGKAVSYSAVYTNPVVYVAPADGSTATPVLLSSVQSFLQARALAQVVVRCAAAGYVSTDVAVLVTVYDQYNQDSVRTGVTTAITNLFNFLNPYGVAAFGRSVTQGDVYNAVISVAGVKICTLTKLCPSGSTGVADQSTAFWMIPQLGTASVSATGGFTITLPTVDVVGGLPGMPGAAGAPTVTSTRCDATTTHLVLAWAAGLNATLYYLNIQYRSVTGAVLQETTMGPYATPAATLDAPQNVPAVSLSVRVVAYNGTTGPVYSAPTSVVNPCH